MEPIVKHIGWIKNGEFKPLDKTRHKEALKALENKQVELFVQERISDETPDQRGYLFGAIIKATCMQTDTFAGWTKEEIYQHFCNLFLKEEFAKEANGILTTVTRIRGVSDLNIKEMSVFIDDIVNYLALRHEIYVLPPDQYMVGRYKTVKLKNGDQRETFIPAQKRSRSAGRNSTADGEIPTTTDGPA